MFNIKEIKCLINKLKDYEKNFTYTFMPNCFYKHSCR